MNRPPGASTAAAGAAPTRTLLLLNFQVRLHSIAGAEVAVTRAGGATKSSLMRPALSPRIVTTALAPMQNDFFEGGAIPVENAAAAVRAANELRQRFDAIVVAGLHKPADHCGFVAVHPGSRLLDTVAVADGVTATIVPDHCILGSWGARFHGALRIDERDPVGWYGQDATAATDSALADRVRGIGKVISQRLAGDRAADLYIAGA